MSDTILKIIPTSPLYIPDSLSEKKCSVYLEEIFVGNNVEIVRTKEIEFIDQGENFDGVFCNICNEEIDMEYWQDKMDEAYQHGFKQLEFISPCCNSVSNLNSLNYDQPAGFAKFCIQITNPDKDLSDENLSRLQTILKTPLKTIWARY